MRSGRVWMRFASLEVLFLSLLELLSWLRQLLTSPIFSDLNSDFPDFYIIPLDTA